MRFNDLHDGLTPGENGSTDSSVLAPVWRCPSHFRFIPYSRHSLGGSGGPKTAKSGHSITSSARLRTEGGMTWLSDLAVAGLTIISDTRMTCRFGKGNR